MNGNDSKGEEMSATISIDEAQAKLKELITNWLLVRK